MAQNREPPALAAVALLLLGVCLLSIPKDARAQESGRAKATGYPNVEVMPPERDKPAMTAEEQLKLKKELGAARDRQAPKGNKGKSSSTGAAKP